MREGSVLGCNGPRLAPCPFGGSKIDQSTKVLSSLEGEQLTGIKVYKIGEEAEKKVYIAGKTADGRWAGLMTTVVET
jgi:hypothetical protein